MNKKDHPEVEAVKGNVELQKMPEPGDAAVEFNDWMYVTEQMLGALTDNVSACSVRARPMPSTRTHLHLRDSA